MAKPREEWVKQVSDKSLANLNNYAEWSEEERRQWHSVGGKASGEARRRRKTLKDTLLLMLEDERLQNDVCCALVREATYGNNAGSVRGAFETLRDTIGEKPRDALEIGNLDDKPLDIMELSKLSDAELRALMSRKLEQKEAECGTDVVQEDT